MKSFCYLTILFITILNGCKSKESPSSVDIMTYPGATLPSLTGQMASIEVVRLQHGDSLLVDDGARLLQRDSSFYIVDTKGEQPVYRFAADGRFLNRIGKKGMGPEEYPYLMDIDIEEEGDDIYILTPSICRLTRYSKDGTFQGKQETQIPVKGFCRQADGFWVFANYHDRTRLFRLDDSLRILDSLCLPLNAYDKFDIPAARFSTHGTQTYCWQWALPAIHKLNAPDGKTTFFDLGDGYPIPEDLLEKELDIEKRGQLNLAQYWESESHALALIGLPAKDRKSIRNIHALKDKHTGQWHYTEHLITAELSFGAEWYASRLRGFDREGRLMCFLYGNEIEELTPEARQLVVNPEALENIDPEMDMFILLCRLK